MAKKIKKSSESKLPKDYDLFIHLLMKLTLSYSIYITGKLSNFTKEKRKEREKKTGKLS